MIKTRKKLAITALAVVMIIVTVFVIARSLWLSFAVSGTSPSGNVTINGGKYLFEGTENDLLYGDIAKYLGPTKDSATSVTIPDTIKVKGYTYSVTKIDDAALSFCTKLKKLAIGKNVSYIGKGAFRGCKNLKNIIIKTPGISSKSIKKDAFTGINKKAVITVPEIKVTDYGKLFKTKGLNGKNQKVKGKRMECDVIPEQIFDSSHPLSNPVYMEFRTGGYFHTKTGEYTPDYWDEEDTTHLYEWEKNTMKYLAGNTVHFALQFEMNSEIHGIYSQRPMYSYVVMCNKCNMRFSTDKKLGEHVDYTHCPMGGYTCSAGYSEAFIEDYWTPDASPCKVELCIALPKGLSYQDGSLKLRHYSIRGTKYQYKISSDAYNTEISDNNIIITIDNLKTKSLLLERGNPTFEFIFDAKVENTASVTNTAKASLHYSYKGAEKTVEFPDVSVHTATMNLTAVDSDGKNLNGGFTLYREKTKYDNAGKGVSKYYKFASGTTGDTPLTFSGLGVGEYKLVYTTGLKQYASYNTVKFRVEAETDKTGIKSLKVVNTSDNPLFSCETDAKTGTINATYIGIIE